MYRAMHEYDEILTHYMEWFRSKKFLFNNSLTEEKRYKILIELDVPEVIVQADKD